MGKTRIQQIKDVCKEEFAFFEGYFNALLMVLPFWIVIVVVLMW